MNFNGMWWNGHNSAGDGPQRSDIRCALLIDGQGFLLTTYWVFSRFWAVALPVMAIVVPLLYIPGIMKLYSHMKNKKVSQKALRVRYYSCVSLLFRSHMETSLTVVSNPTRGDTQTHGFD
jgi:hypothetical protein